KEEDAETRGRGDTETGRRGDGETRGRGDAETRGRGDAETRGRGDAETRRRGDAETGRRGDGETRGRGDGETWRRGDAETGGRADTETRRRGDAETGRRGDGETRGRGDAETRGRGDAEKEIENTINVADRNQLISFDRVRPFGWFGCSTVLDALSCGLAAQVSHRIPGRVRPLHCRKCICNAMPSLTKRAFLQLHPQNRLVYLRNAPDSVACAKPHRCWSKLNAKRDAFDQPSSIVLHVESAW